MPLIASGMHADTHDVNCGVHMFLARQLKHGHFLPPTTLLANQDLSRVVGRMAIGLARPSGRVCGLAFYAGPFGRLLDCVEDGCRLIV